MGRTAGGCPLLAAAGSDSPLKLRSDLVFQRRESEGAVSYIVKGNDSGRFFRIGEVEHFIANQLDGAVSVEDLCRRVEERFGSHLTAEGLSAFLGRLERLGLLEAAGGATPSASGRRIQGDVLYLRLKAFDPDRLLGRLAAHTGWVFSPATVAICALFIALGIAVLLASGPQIDRSMSALYRFEAIFLVWLTLLGVTVVHEFAHGLTCKHFGGQVREMGFMLIYLQPAMYCNVSEAWLFPERAKRLWVTFSGAYVEITIWALAILLWRVTEPHTTVNTLALLVMATSGVKTLFNLNPLIKLDGYYLLSDWLEIPNLRARAFAYLRSWLWRGNLGTHDSATPRERRIYLAYSLLAGAFSLWFLVLVSRWVGGWLVGRYQTWGFFLFLGVLAMMLRGPLRSTFVWIHEVLRSRARALAVTRRLRHPLLALLVLGPLLYLTRLELRVAGEFVVAPVHNHDVRAEVDGIIEAIFAKEGEHVESGALLARLADRDLRAEFDQVAAAIEEGRARHRLLVAGARPEQIAVARTAVEKARERLKYAGVHLERISSLHAQQLASLKHLDEAREEAAVRGKELEENQGTLRLLQAGSRPEEVEAVEAELTRLEARARHLEDQLGRVRIVSPIAGVVTTPKLDERVGEYVRRGDLVAEVHELETVTVEIAIPEKEISEVAVGQTVELKARAFPGRAFQGVVAAIAPIVTREDLPYAEGTVIVSTRLENPGLLLKPRMTGTARVLCGERRILDLLTRRLARYLRVEFWSLW